ncbi:MAG TPA: AmmeMemoRadiSam system protein B [Lentisphaeria bacterium]|nr:MAG: AmmeMemoRadiSam system protein B [Lentisphaerae bacterium GWF2_49_21]HBC87873.1 AmmeMemoRadiSam system protein B [Lentisphaeria bacterium]
MKAGFSVREPAVAGQFYDANPMKLKADVEKMLSSADTGKAKAGYGKVQAVIVPHAGYVYSGKTAAKTLKTAEGGDYKRAVVISPTHMFPFEGIVAASFKAYKTPLGNIEVDLDAVEKLLNSKTSYISEMTEAHIPEHSLEVELPFLQILFPDIKLIPFVCGQIETNSAGEIAEALSGLLVPENLWVISSDFTHFGRSFGYKPFSENIPEKLKELDMGAVDKITALDFRGFSSYIDRTRATICGANPIRILLKTIELVKKTGAVFEPELVEYTTSGEMTGDYSHCVSYAGISIRRKTGT